MREIKGKLTKGAEAQIGIVVSRFNETISRSLLQGALEVLEAHGVPSEQISVTWVPGAFEIPVAAKKLARDHDAVVTLGCVIRGATTHYDYVCGQCASGVMRVGLESEKPVLFGLLTTETIEQAIERSGTKAGNKGADVALAALEMISVIEQCEQEQMSLA